MPCCLVCVFHDCQGLANVVQRGSLVTTERSREVIAHPQRLYVANIAEKAGVLGGDFTKEAFLADLHDWESAVKPAYTEHKIALGYGVYGTPKHVIDGKLVPDTESAWGAADWAEKLKSL